MKRGRKKPKSEEPDSIKPESEEPDNKEPESDKTTSDQTGIDGVLALMLLTVGITILLCIWFVLRYVLHVI